MRLIDADTFEVVAVQGKSDDFVEGVQYVLEMIDNAPTVNTKPVRHGLWGNYEPSAYGYRCSYCKNTHRTCALYCPHCRAMMDIRGK